MDSILSSSCTNLICGIDDRIPVLVTLFRLFSGTWDEDAPPSLTGFLSVFIKSKIEIKKVAGNSIPRHLLSVEEKECIT